MKIKGNIVIGQSGGPTAAINATLAGVFSAGKELAEGKVYGMLGGVEGLLKENFIDMCDNLKTDRDVELLKRTPSSYLGSCRFKLPEPQQGNEIYEKLFEIFEKHNIKGFFYIGGNDSMDTVKKLSIYNDEYKKTDIKFMGVPKTIDNDLVVTDHTPGFGSAAKFVATVTKELVRDSLVYDLKSVTIVEIMGRDAGWLTGASALAKGDDCEGAAMILLPEVPFDYEYVKNRVAQLMEEGSKSLVITVSEGVRTKEGKYVCELGSEKGTDAFGHTMLTGTAATIATMLKNDLGIKTRAVELSTLQRCASHIASATDISESFAVGQAAVKAAANGESGKMALLKRVSNNPYICVTDTHDVREVANLAKEVPQSMINENGDNVTEEFIEYVRPLIEGELSQLTVNGLPQHIRLG
ncbi:MAG: 6-phosphofructokinase [Clostridia bacterium]|nr:6-phosphofructokinase [Clostridia bacterium]